MKAYKLRSILLIAGVTAIVSAARADNPQLTATLYGADSAANDYLVGGAVIPGTIAVGAPYDDVTATDDGSVYIFGRTAAGSWSQAQKITRADTAASSSRK